MHSRPSLTVEEVPTLVMSLYGLNVKVVSELDSYDDRNYLVSIVDNSSQSHEHPSGRSHGYVLKVLNYLDSKNHDAIDIQNQMILHAKKKGYPTPGPIRNLKGDYQSLVPILQRQPGDTSTTSELFVVRLFEFMPGTTLDRVTLTTKLCYEIGEFAGRLDVALRDFCLENGSSLQAGSNKWNMVAIPKLLDVLHVITDMNQRKLLKEVIDLFIQNVLNCQEHFSKGFIHADLNDCNILVNSNIDEALSPNPLDGISTELISERKNSEPISKNADHRLYHLAGVIDFGDSTHSLYIFEASAAMMYVMVNRDNIPPIEAAGKVLAGYLQYMELTATELDHLKLCICSRLAQSYIIAYYSLSIDPDHTHTLFHAKHIWPVLSNLWKTPDSEVLRQLLSFCN